MHLSRTHDWNLLSTQGAPFGLGPHQRFMRPTVLGAHSATYPPPLPFVTTLIQADGLGGMEQTLTHNTQVWCSGLDALSDPACRLESGVPPGDVHDDDDGDGFPSATDCDDGSSGLTVHPARDETPNSIDEDCNCYFVTPGGAWNANHLAGLGGCSFTTSAEENP